MILRAASSGRYRETLGNSAGECRGLIDLLSTLSDLQARHVRKLITAAGQRIDYQSLPDMTHNMNRTDPQAYARILREWAGTLDNVRVGKTTGSSAQGGHVNPNLWFIVVMST